MNEWWKSAPDECVSKLNSDAVSGLDDREVVKRRNEVGPNLLIERGLKSPWRILWEQLTGIMVVILIIAAVVSAAMGEYTDAAVIGIIVTLNALLGLSQEYRAEKAMAALKRLAVPTVRVRRNGKVQEIASPDLVPGDVVLLEAGNLVPADCRLLETANLRIQEAALTGESEPVEKDPAALAGEAASLGDRRNMAYMGTVVAYGRGVCLAVETGMRTELGGIARMIQSVHREPTPMQKRLEQLGKGIAIAALFLVAIIFVQGIIRGGTSPANLKLMFLTAISMAVAAVPEGLPAVVTIALALGAQRMLRRHALIRKLLAVETLGSVTVICSDKTGTLTENRMTVTTAYVAGKRIGLESRSRPGPDRHAGLGPLLAAGSLCNDAVLKGQAGNGAESRVIGDPTEGALVLAAAESGLVKETLEQALPRIAETPFDSDRKRMTTVHKTDPAGLPDWCAALQTPGTPPAPFIAFCKGAADSLLSVCTNVWGPDGVRPITAERRSAILAAHDDLAQSGMRILGMAYRFLDREEDTRNPEHDLVFLGLIGMIDPPRQEVKEAVLTCKAAGIRPVMITGDHPLTAREIARQLGISSQGAILTGAELETMSVDELRERVEEVAVYARVSPQHKLKIVEALQQRGHVVAMTGDGVNDAPALRKADIGVAMGITGTDVSKEAADMVLQDDNFATLVAAVKEGRVIYDNIRKFIKYLLSTNSGELWVMLLAPFAGLPFPLAPIQILWMNLVTDSLPALALGIEPAERDIMSRRPRRLTDSIFGEGLAVHIVWTGLFMAAVTLGAGFWIGWSGRLSFSNPHDLAYYSTMVFTLLTLLQMAHVLAIRSNRQSLFTLGLWSNKPLVGAVILTVLLQTALVYTPWLGKIFRTVPLSARDFGICLALSTSLFWAIELEKLVRRLRRHR